MREPGALMGAVCGAAVAATRFGSSTDALVASLASVAFECGISASNAASAAKAAAASAGSDDILARARPESLVRDDDVVMRVCPVGLRDLPTQPEAHSGSRAGAEDDGWVLL